MIPSNLGEYSEHFGGVCCELFKMLMQWSLRASFYPLFIALLHGNTSRRGGGDQPSQLRSIKECFLIITFSSLSLQCLLSAIRLFEHILLVFQKTGEQKQALCWNEHFSKPSMNPKVNEANISNGRRNPNEINGEKVFLALPVLYLQLPQQLYT